MPRVHLTRIYTNTGADECNAALGVALALGQLDDELTGVLTTVQNDLFDVGADLCNPTAPDPRYPPLRVTDAQVERVEGWCDDFNSRLPALDSFILPGGTPGAALLHVARPVCRRAERSAWAVVEVDDERTGRAPIRYLNRLSD